MNKDVAFIMLNSSIQQAAKVSAVIAQAKAENRDVSMDELNSFVQSDDIAKLQLDAAIKKASG